MNGSALTHGPASVLKGDRADVVASGGAVLFGGGLDVGEFVLGVPNGHDFGARVGARGSAGAGHGHSLESTRPATIPSTSSLASHHLSVYDKSMTTNAVPLECVECEREIVGEPVRDAEQVQWLGDDALTFCSTDCLANAGERQATS